MGGRDSLRKWSNFRLSRARDLDLDLGSGHTAYRRASLVDLYLHARFNWNRRNFLWTDGRTYGLADGHLRPTLLGRLGGVDVIMHKTACCNCFWLFLWQIKCYVTKSHRVFWLHNSLLTHRCRVNSEYHHLHLWLWFPLQKFVTLHFQPRIHVT